MSVKSLLASQLHQSHYALPARAPPRPDSESKLSVVISLITRPRPWPRPGDSDSKLSVVIVLLRNALCMNFLLIFLFNLINNHGEGHVPAVTRPGQGHPNCGEGH